VLVRIHFLRALLATLQGADAAPHLRQFTEALRAEGSRHSWQVDPMLQALCTRLGADSLEFFAELADTLNGRSI
jgi:hypothetical protein